MLSKLFVLLCIVGFMLCAPQDFPSNAAPSTPIPILSQNEEVEANGTIKYSFETGNGIKFEESSYDKAPPPGFESRSGISDNGTTNEIHVQEGSYSYTAPDGTVISLRYTADENGFQPVGDHLPTTPPIPEAILKSLQAEKASDDSSNANAPGAF